MNLTAPRNPNYSATVVELKDFVQLEGCDRIQAALIFGNHVPVETALSDEFMRSNNLYRKPEWGNVNPEAKGFFEQTGRVKCVRFRGHKSEGFYIPITSLSYLDPGYLGDPFVHILGIGDTFDYLDDHEICRKYIPRRNPGSLHPAQKRQLKLIDSIAPSQFRFHPDTEQLRRNLHKIDPNDVISISDKWHGTSVVISNILVNTQLRWWEKLLKRLGARIETTHYGPVYSSRKVIKAVDGVEKHNNHFYGSDIWGVVAKEVSDKIPTGYTLYGEIVGFTPEGSPIQGGYHYGCPVGGHKFLVYRVTSTGADGRVLELSWPQMFDFTKKYGLEMVKELYYGKANDLLNFESFRQANYLPIYEQSIEAWRQSFLEKLEKLWVNDGLCEYNNNEVPAEGIVVRKDGLEECEAFKLKNFAFLERETKELDKGTVDVETVESEEAA